MRRRGAGTSGAAGTRPRHAERVALRLRLRLLLRLHSLRLRLPLRSGSAVTLRHA